MNDLISIILILEVFLIFILLGWRTVWNVARRESIPLLQARDLLLFSFYVTLTIATQFVRVTGYPLGQQAWWVIFTDAFQLTVGTVYLAIELFAIGKGRSKS